MGSQEHYELVKLVSITERQVEEIKQNRRDQAKVLEEILNELRMLRQDLKNR